MERLLFSPFFCVWMCCAVLGWGAATKTARAAEYHVATDGDDDSGDGSAANPWRTIQHAVNTGVPAAGGDTILVADGVYAEMNTITRGFSARVTVRAANAYGATLTNVDGGQEALRVYVNGSANVTIEGFVITNAHPSYPCDGGREQYYLIHIQDASDVTLRNNIIFGANAPGTCNEVVKINRGSDVYMTNVVLRGNVLYDPANAGGADILDAVRPGELDICDNIFWGNPQKNRSQSFITLKRQAPAPANPRQPRYIIRRNIFLNWGGKTDQAFLQFGEDGVDTPEISDALVENNLFIGNSAARMAAPMQFKGPRQIVVRHNTIVGDLPSGSFGFRVGTEGSNPTVQDIQIQNNIFSDPTGTMEDRFFNAYGDVDLGSVTLATNLFWNAQNGLPQSGDLLPTDDPTLVNADPHIDADQQNLTLPRWDTDTGAFESGATTIREEFLRLVETYGALGDGSGAIDRGTGQAPADDIRRQARDGHPDLGAYEHGASEPAPDGGPTSDSGVDPDGAPQKDGGTNPDGSATADGGSSQNSGSSGCSCRTVKKTPALEAKSTCRAWMLLLLLIMARAFRYRHRRRWSG